MKPYPFLILTAILLAGCDLRPKEHFEQPALEVRVLPIAERAYVHTHTYVGEIEESNKIPLSMPAGGQVTSVRCHVGDKVQAGQILLQVDSARAHDIWQSAEATLRQAEDGYRRAQEVFLEGGVTEQKMVEIRSQLTQARSMASMAERSLHDCSLRAPQSGTIGQCDAHVGQQLTPGLTVITILDMKGYNVVFSVPEDEVAGINVGDKGCIDVAAIGATSLPMQVIEKDPTANRVARTYQIKARCQNPPEQLMPNMIAKVRLESQQISGFMVPRSAVVLYHNEPTLWIAHDSTAVRRSVVVGEYIEDGVLITDGLDEGDQVIVAGIQKLWQGAEITY